MAPRDSYKPRQAVALVAAARWITAASVARAESRGLHRREDIPGGIIATTIGFWSAVWTTSGLLLIPFCRS